MNGVVSDRPQWTRHMSRKEKNKATEGKGEEKRKAQNRFVVHANDRTRALSAKMEGYGTNDENWIKTGNLLTRQNMQPPPPPKKGRKEASKPRETSPKKKETNRKLWC